MVTGLKHFFTRPLPWLLLHLVNLLPALLLGPLLVGSFTWMARYPLFRIALTERSLDGRIDIFMHAAEAASDASPLTLIGFALLSLLLPVLLSLRVFLEGGVLLTYAEPTAPGLRRFFTGCWRWLGTFLAINLLGWIAITLIAAVGGALVALVWNVALWLGQTLAVLTLLLLGVLVTWIELARAAAVAHDTRNVFAALRESGALFVRRPLQLLGLVGGALAVQVLLMLLSRAVMRAIPIPWWLLSLAVGQLVIFLRLGMRMARRAGMVGLCAVQRQA